MFLWGAATSSHQIDGNNVASDWWRWEQEGNIEGGESSSLACDHWNRFPEDLRLASELGLNSYRFSIEWARLEPEEGKWERSAFEWYRELLDQCEKYKLLPMATLHHFTLPEWVASRGGFTNEHTPGWFTGYVKRVVQSFGSRIPLWCTLNEPNTLAIGQYLGGYMPPAQYQPNHVTLASRNLLKCHVQGYDTIHGKMPQRQGPWREHPLMVGIAHNMIDFVPWNRGNPIEQFLTQTIRRFYNQTWPDAVTGRKQHFGIRGFLPYAPQVTTARGRRTSDFIGVNYYTKIYVCFRPFRMGSTADENAFPMSSTSAVGITFSKKADPVSDVGWVIHPKGLGRMLRFLGRYRLPIYITENGIADRLDEKRADFIDSHLREVFLAQRNGIDVRGYFHWSLLDNFEWVKGFAPRFGLYEVDYLTQERRRRPSADFLTQAIQKFLQRAKLEWENGESITK